MTEKNDSIDARIPASCPASVSQILYHAWHHDIAGIKPLLNVPGRASVQEPKTGETPLHAAIRACAPVNQGALSDGTDNVEEHAKTVVHELFMSGAIWNDVDNNNETPGCIAARLGLKELYTLCVEAGVRAELLFGLLDGYEELESDDGDEEEGEEEEEKGEHGPQDEEEKDFENSNGGGVEEDIEVIVDSDRAFVPPKGTVGPNVNSADYLRSNLTYSDGKLVDSAQNGVMMAWETSIMRASVDALLPGLPAGRKILNIGFGMGIVDRMFAETRPAKHHIIEAHPSVLEHVNSSDSKFGKEWETSGPAEGAFKVHGGKWQEVVPKLLEQGETYDAIYFDTFGEDYGQLRMFFTEYVPGLLEEQGRFGFFNGLGADRKICYDVYTQVVEMHLSDAGMDVEWQELDVDMKDLGKEGEGEWQGVKRRYWTLDKYRLPTCTLMG
ncbi:Protein arginine N-methyltransferase 2 [Daldinia childiae]|uniref:Protein arginine N-methyltransferase 2 n=1 Tax=Daldinia childiae TaxID=326645 RepID=UPI001446F8FB|nr:Protein arginine N-methyltransferase 2 [Daldinia childiae]KAF3062816.1 Protein arginine N-methyltransferase 2 [Daldinia childiae]